MGSETRRMRCGDIDSVTSLGCDRPEGHSGLHQSEWGDGVTSWPRPAPGPKGIAVSDPVGRLRFWLDCISGCCLKQEERQELYGAIDELRHARAQLQQDSAMISTILGDLEDRKRERNEARAALEDLHTLESSHHTALAALDEKIRVLTDQLADQQRTSEELLGRAEGAEGERDTALAELATLRREVEGLRATAVFAALLIGGRERLDTGARELLAELTELRRDRERLEWLEHTGPNGSWEGLLILYYETDLNGDLREAIDACMTDVAIDAARAASEGEGK